MADEQPTVEQTIETQETKEEQTNQEVTKAPETKFTEEDVNNIVKQRLAKERASIYKKLDVEELDTAVHAVKAIKEAEQQKQIQKGEFLMTCNRGLSYLPIVILYLNFYLLHQRNHHSIKS